jgi:hypothetical protein
MHGPANLDDRVGGVNDMVMGDIRPEEKENLYGFPPISSELEDSLRDLALVEEERDSSASSGDALDNTFSMKVFYDYMLVSVVGMAVIKCAQCSFTVPHKSMMRHLQRSHAIGEIATRDLGILS